MKNFRVRALLLAVSLFFLAQIPSSFGINLHSENSATQSMRGSTTQSSQEKLKQLKKKNRGIIADKIWTEYSYSNYFVDILNSRTDILYLGNADALLAYFGELEPLDCLSKFKRYTGITYSRSGPEFLIDTQKVRKSRPDIIILLEADFKNHTFIGNGLNHVTKLVKLVQDLELDGVHLSVTSMMEETINGDNEKLSKFYVEYTQEIRKQIGNDKILSLAGDWHGAFSCISYESAGKHCRDNDSPYSESAIEDSKKKEYFRLFTGLFGTGLAIAPINALKDKIDIFIVKPNLTYYREEYKDAVIDYYESYLYFGKKYNFVILMQMDIKEGGKEYPGILDYNIQTLGDHIHRQNDKLSRSDGMITVSIGDKYLKDKIEDVMTKISKLTG